MFEEEGRDPPSEGAPDASPSLSHCPVFSTVHGTAGSLAQWSLKETDHDFIRPFYTTILLIIKRAGFMDSFDIEYTNFVIPCSR